MRPAPLDPATRTLVFGVLAGLAGGLAEIGWVWSYARVEGGDALRLAVGISEALRLPTSSFAATVVLGVAIHIALALLLGVALAVALKPALMRLRGPAARYALIMGALALVWLVNFFLVLPRLSPEFVLLLPYPVSLVSKLLFGFAAALVFNARLPVARPRRRA